MPGGGGTITRTAVDNVGHETTASCTTLVGFTHVIAGNIKGKLTVNAGESVQLTSTAKASGAVTVKAGGALDVEGATLSGGLKAKGASLVRICGATVSGTATPASWSTNPTKSKANPNSSRSADRLTQLPGRRREPSAAGAQAPTSRRPRAEPENRL